MLKSNSTELNGKQALNFFILKLSEMFYQTAFFVLL